MDLNKDVWPPSRKKASKINLNSSNSSVMYASDITPDAELSLDKNPRNRINRNAFVILNRYQGRQPVDFVYKKGEEDARIKDFVDVISSVEKIKKFHPNSQIIIVDANSPNKDYIDLVKAMDNSIIIEDIKNNNYEPGGIVYAFKKYKNFFDSFFFLQDSVLINNKIDEILTINSNEWFALTPCPCGWGHTAIIDQSQALKIKKDDPCNIRDTSFFKFGIKSPIFVGLNQAKKTNDIIISSYDIPFNIAYCNSFLIKSEGFERLINNSEIINICPLPENKDGSCAWERIWPLAFQELNFKLKFIKTEFQYDYGCGPCRDGFGAKITDKFTKFYMGRT